MEIRQVIKKGRKSKPNFPEIEMDWKWKLAN
jgi:hypothetical protein